MILNAPCAILHIPDGTDEVAALARTTHLAIGAHQDDLEIMAPSGILACYKQPDKWFAGVVVTDGRGAPKIGDYAALSPEAYVQVRNHEQLAAADLGGYAAQFLLGYESEAVKRPNVAVTADLTAILMATRPEVVYTHNLADKHPTHVGVALRVLEAARACAPEFRPRKLYGCEVWRDLDWLEDNVKVALDASGNDALLNGLLGCFQSQLAVKRYDRAAAGRRMANATYHQSHVSDTTSALVYAMDLSPLLENPELDPAQYVAGFTAAFAQLVNNAINHFAK